MGRPIGEAESNARRLDFDRRCVLQFRGGVVTADGAARRSRARRRAWSERRQVGWPWASNAPKSA